MIIGIPKEIKEEENRVAVTPTGVAAFVSHGHKVLVENGAGLGSAIRDGAYEAAGAQLLESGEHIWQRADLLMYPVRGPLDPSPNLPGSRLPTRR